MKPRDKQQKNYITWKMQSFFNYLNPKVSHLILNNIYKLVRRLPLSNEKKKGWGGGESERSSQNSHLQYHIRKMIYNDICQAHSKHYRKLFCYQKAAARF